MSDTDEGVLGPPWSKVELETFLVNLRRFGQAWQRIVADLPGRSPAMVGELYKMNATLLAIPSINADFLFATMADKQRSMPHLFMQDNEPPPAKRARLTRSSSKENSRKPTPQRRSRRRLFGNEQSSVPVSSHPSANWTPPPSRVPLKNASPDGSVEDEAVDILTMLGSPVPKRTHPKNGYTSPPVVTRPKRKRGRAKPRHVVANETRLTNVLKQAKIRKWCEYEWFYSDIDDDFFRQNEFHGCLESLHLGNVKYMTKMQWRYIRSLFGCPRRMSKKFLQTERTMLELHRENARRKRAKLEPREMPPEYMHIMNLPSVPLLPVGCTVFAKNPSSMQGNIEQGRITQQQSHTYEVQFAGGRHNVSDFHVMPTADVKRDRTRSLSQHATLTPVKEDLATYSVVALPGNQKQVHQIYSNTDLSNVAELFNLLEKKEVLIKELRYYNNVAEQNCAIDQQFTEDFKREYAWILVKLEETNKALEPALHKFRERQQEIRKSWPELFKDDVPTSAIPTMPSEWHNWYSEISDTCKKTAQYIVDRSIKSMQEEQARRTGGVGASLSSDVVECIYQVVAFLLNIQTCAERGYTDEELSLAFSSALTRIRPKYQVHMPLFNSIKDAITEIKSSLVNR